MSDVIDEPEVDPDFKYDTVDMTEEQYEALKLRPVIVPKTPKFNINSLFDNLPEGADAYDQMAGAAHWLSENLEPSKLQDLMHKWEFWARSNQLSPPGRWTYWVLLAGRGFGKTRTGAEWVHEKVEAGTAKRIALVAPTAADVRKVMVEGESGLLATAKPWNRPVFEPSKLQLVWPNGAIAQMFSAEEPERLRGPQCDTFWADEVAAWKNLQNTWDMLQFGFRLGRHPQGCITTTPKPVPIIKELVKQNIAENADPEAKKTIVLVKGSTYDNVGNLATPFMDQIVKKYEGTRLGRQELDAEILEDMPGALWSRGGIDENRVKTSAPSFKDTDLRELLEYDLEANPGSNWYSMQLEWLKERAASLMAEIPDTLSRIVVAVDPNVSNTEGSDEIGIVIGGKGLSGQGYVLADFSTRGSPNEWASVAVLAHDIFGADRIIGEANQGGNMVEHTIASAAKFLKLAHKRASDHIGITMVHATRGKVTRAEPVSALYEQNRISHVGTHTVLEDQMCLFTSNFDRKAMGYSPDRVDALVWSLHHLYLEGSDTGILEFYQMQALNKQASAAAKLEPLDKVKMKTPGGIVRVFGRSGQLYFAVDGHVSVDPDDVPGLRTAGFKEV